jgi:cytidylate kinase
MAKVSLADHLKEQRSAAMEQPENAGPFVTISRQYGCHGFSLGLLLLELCNEDAEPGKGWKIYQKEILERLAEETDLSEEILDQQRRSRPRMLVDFFRSLSKERMPSGYEIRHKISTIIRGLAIDGHAIIVGQGGAAATHDLENGLAIRLEAPEDWRVKQVAFRESLSETEAKQLVRNNEQEREYLRKIYERQIPRKPAYQVLYDCSRFSLTEIAQNVVHMMRLKKLL